MKTGRALFVIALIIASAICAGSASGYRRGVQNETSRLTAEEAKKLKSPVPFSKESIARGRELFARNCTACHGNDGKSQVDVVANATDLTEPKMWRSGTAEGEIFRSIRDGAGDTMPSFKAQFRKEEDLWHLVNFIRSLWPEPMRPKLQSEK
jgi:cbb3-type cytochrome c oxidase subunit III